MEKQEKLFTDHSIDMLDKAADGAVNTTYRHFLDLIEKEANSRVGVMEKTGTFPFPEQIVALKGIASKARRAMEVIDQHGTD